MRHEKKQPVKRAAFPLSCFISLQQAANCQEQRREYQRYNCHQLDQDVDGRAGSILEGVTNGITDNGCCVCIRAFTAVVAFFNVLLRIVPFTAGIGHEDSHHNTCYQRTCKQAVTKDEAEKPAVDVDAMSADEREALLQKLLAKKEAD